MRGSPPLQLAILLLGFFALAVPLVQLTSARPVPLAGRPAPAAEAAAPRPMLVRIRHAHKPASLSLMLGGKELLPPPESGASPLEIRTTFAIPAEGIEFSLHATWPAGTPDTPLTLEVEPDALDMQSQTLWSIDGRIDDTLAFAWKP